MIAELPPYSALTSHGEGAFVRVLEPQLHRLIRSILPQIEVDEDWYRSQYRDVHEAVQEGRTSSARHHYIEAGYFEGRLPRRVVVDEKWYLESYPDVAEAVKRGRFTNAQTHFEKDGFREGRLPYPGWTL